MAIVLASSSPRRARLLKQAGIPFRVMPAEGAENWPPARPFPGAAELTRYFALQKAGQVAGRLAGGIVLGADTVVAHRGEILGRPANRREAQRMLRRLSGDEHRVITGIALVDAAAGRQMVDAVETRVWMKELGEGLINAYVLTGEPLDKAGAYGIQGKAALFIEKIEGCYFNVMGLPLSRLCLMLSRIGIAPWTYWRDSVERGEADY